MSHRTRVDVHWQAEPEIAIALAWQPVASRPALATLFALDARLAGVVSRAKEPLLAQMRLAWWRDRLGERPGADALGEPLLDDLADRWSGHVSLLKSLVDGWESLLGEAPLSSSAIGDFASGRGDALAAFASLAGADRHSEAARTAGQGWALADLAWRSSDASERDTARSLGREIDFVPIRARALRGIAVLGGLSRRSLTRGEPLMRGRGAALAAIRLGMLGR